MNSNSTKTFIVFILILGIVVVIAQIAGSFIQTTTSTAEVAAQSIVQLPDSFPEAALQAVTDRAQSSLPVLPDNFENGIITSVAPTVTPTPTPTLTPTPTSTNIP